MRQKYKGQYKDIDQSRRMYFQYNPPRPENDENTYQSAPKPPYKNAERYKCSVYYYWWEFLRLNEDYQDPAKRTLNAKMQEVYRDFGDVRDDDFVGWWINRGRDLFCEDRKSIEVVHDLSELPKYYNDYRLVAIPRYGEIDRVMTEIHDILIPLLSGTGEYMTFSETTKKSTAKYPVYTTPHLKSLHEHLVVGRIEREFIANNSRRPTLRELGDSAAIKIHNYNGGRGAAEFIDDKKVDLFRRGIKHLVDNVGIGIFPAKDKVQRQRS